MVRAIIFFPLLSSLALNTDLALSQTSEKVELLAHVPFPDQETGDVWASGDYVFVARRAAGLSIVDVSNPRAPQIVFEQDFGFNQDVKVSGKYAFLTNETNGGPGLYILDISDPANTRVVSTVQSAAVESVHNVYATGQYAYIVSNTSGDIRIIDVSDPSAPAEVGRFQAESGFPHDVTVIGDRMYTAFLSGGFQISDIADKTNPRLLGSRNYAGAVTHNIWPTRDGRYVLTTDETNNGHVRVWDIGDLASISQVGAFIAKPDIVVHNVLVDRRYAYVAYYVDGLQILDVDDPRDPVPVGSYDTFPGPDVSGFNGAWGVYPYGKHLYVSDLNSGLYVLEFADRKTGTIHGHVTDSQTGAKLEGAKIEAIEKPVSTFSRGDGSYELTTTVDTLRLVYTIRGFLPDTLEAAIVQDQQLALDVALVRGTVTAVNEASRRPGAFALMQNYPNPFNPKTTISFELGLSSHVRLAVYNGLGEQVMVALNRVMDAGRHTYQLDARALASGIYIYRLEINSRAGRFVQSRKMALVR